MCPHAPIGESLSKRRKSDPFLLSALRRVVDVNSISENVYFSVCEHFPPGKKCGVRALEAVG